MPTSLLKNKPPGRVLAQPGACLYAPLAQLVEQLTLNQWVLGSSPRWCTTKYLARNCGVFFYCLFLRELPFVHHWGREWLGSRARTKKKKPKNIRWKVFRLFVISLEWRKQYDWSADGYLYHRDDWKSFY